VWKEFEIEVASKDIRFVSLKNMLIQDAAELLGETHPNAVLRTLDTHHPAPYLSVETGPILTEDFRMLRAATKPGLPLAV
jgi:hypothetical protein